MLTGLKTRLNTGLAKWRDGKAAAFIRKRKTLLICLVFAVAALSQGIYYSYKLPFGQTPDEIPHYQWIENEFGTSGFTAELTYKLYFNAELDKLPNEPEEKVNQALLREYSEIRFETPLTISSFHPGPLIIRHLPSGIGYYLGIALGFPILTCTYLAEIFSVLFYVGIGCLTLKITPVRKELFAFCMLIPEMIQQCSSVNYDAVAFPCAMLLFACILRLYYGDMRVRWRHLCPCGLLALVLLIAKPPYALIILMGLIVPVNRFELKIGRKFELADLIRKHRIWVIAGIIAACAAGIWVLRENYYMKVFLSDILNLPQFIALLARTWNGLGYYHLTQMVGMFGWLESQVSPMFLLVFFVMATYLCMLSIDNTKRKLTIGRRIWILAIAGIILLMTEVALQGWTYDYNKLAWDVSIETMGSYIADTPTILGVQGRYWIPVFLPILVALSGNVKRKHIGAFWAVQGVYYLYALLNVSRILNARYWIGGIM